MVDPVNSPETAPGLVPQPHGGALKGPWEKGVSGNPGGRALSLQRKAREYTQDGDLLIQLHVGIVSADPEKLALLRIDKPPTIAERQASAKELADRGWGRARDTEDATAGDGINWPAVFERLGPDGTKIFLAALQASHTGPIVDIPQQVRR
jgi:hypothetical protein